MIVFHEIPIHHNSQNVLGTLLFGSRKARFVVLWFTMKDCFNVNKGSPHFTTQFRSYDIDTA